MTSFRSHLTRIGAAALLAGLTFGATAGMASAQYWNGGPPPPPRHERFAVRHGYQWAGGHWVRAGGRWVWQPGRYVARAPGRHWVNGYWRATPRGRMWIEGHWG